MVLSSHQPNFLPYMGVFYKAYKSDVFVFSDDVCYSKKGMHNYNFIRSNKGVKKLTIPVSSHHNLQLADIKLVEPEYNVRKISKTLTQEYAKSPHFEEGRQLVEYMESVSKKTDTIAQFNELLLNYLFVKFNIITKCVTATSIGIKGHKDDRILQMCKIIGADVYYSGTGAKAYHKNEMYRDNCIDLIYSDYEQKSGFIENLSVADWIFYNGFVLPKEWR